MFMLIYNTQTNQIVHWRFDNSSNTITAQQAFDLCPYDKTNLTLSLRTSLVGVFKTIKDLWKSKLQGAKINAEFVGSANVDGITFPIKTKLA